MSMNPHRHPSSFPSHPINPSDILSLPSSDEDDEEEELDTAEIEWQESLSQLTLLFNLVLLPLTGKYFGRKFAYFRIPRCYIG